MERTGTGHAPENCGHTVRQGASASGNGVGGLQAFLPAALVPCHASSMPEHRMPELRCPDLWTREAIGGLPLQHLAPAGAHVRVGKPTGRV